MPKVHYSACRAQRARRQPEPTKSLEPSRLGYYQNLVVWNKVDPVAPVAPIVRIFGGVFFLSIKHSNAEGVSCQVFCQLWSLVWFQSQRDSAMQNWLKSWGGSQSNLGPSGYGLRIVYFAIQILIAVSRLLSMTQPRLIWFNWPR